MLIVVIMGPGKEHFYKMCYDSVKTADEVLYFTSDTSKVDVSKNTYWNGWNNEDKQTNGKARNVYMAHLKEHYPNDWALVLDEDEVLEGIDNVKDFVRSCAPGVYNVRMRHFIGDLGHEDGTRETHFVPGRLFKISEAIQYPLHSHPILVAKEYFNYSGATIWHLGHMAIEYMDYILKRYKQHASDSVIHTQEFLKGWKLAHLLGKYPVREIDPIELPKQVLDRYEIDRDMFYFRNRGVETKHFIMLKQWIGDRKPTILDIGCGLGSFGLVANYLGCDCYKGIDISKWAVERNPYSVNLGVHDITKGPYKLTGTVKRHLGLAIDILEHLRYEDLDNALRNIKESVDEVIFSIPFKGDPNLEQDKTHIIKEDRIWWIEKLSRHFKIREAPKEWLYANQLLIGKSLQ